MFMYQLGHALGEVDVDRIAALPMPVLMGWRDFFDITAKDGGGTGKTWMSPDKAQAQLRQLFRG